MKQRTIRNSIRASGVALHSGKNINLILRPAPEEHGIVFRRVDLPQPVDIPATAYNVRSDAELATVLGIDGIEHTVSTVEHLLSALAGLGIDNVIAEVEGSEMPIMDGSAASYVFLLQSAGIVEQSHDKKFIRVKKPIRIKEGDKEAAFLPFNGFKVTCAIEFDHPVMRAGNTELSIDFSHTSFINEVSRARTFGFKKDLENMHKRRLALGGSLDNAILLDEHSVVNAGGMRFPNAEEFVRHKVLDAFGDLYLAGHTIIGEFKGRKSGHRLNNKLLRELLSTEDAYAIESGIEQISGAPVFFAGSLLPT